MVCMRIHIVHIHTYIYLVSEQLFSRYQKPLMIMSVGLVPHYFTAHSCTFKLASHHTGSPHCTPLPSPWSDSNDQVIFTEKPIYMLETRHILFLKDGRGGGRSGNFKRCAHHILVCNLLPPTHSPCGSMYVYKRVYMSFKFTITSHRFVTLKRLGKEAHPPFRPIQYWSLLTWPWQCKAKALYSLQANRRVPIIRAQNLATCLWRQSQREPKQKRYNRLWMTNFTVSVTYLMRITFTYSFRIM
jgi:hypothetical protein